MWQWQACTKSTFDPDVALCRFNASCMWVVCWGQRIALRMKGRLQQDTLCCCAQLEKVRSLGFGYRLSQDFRAEAVAS